MSDGSKTKITESEAASRFVLHIVKEVEETWPTILQCLNQALPGDLTIKNDPLSHFEFSLAVIAQDLLALENLFSKDQAERIEGFVYLFIDTKEFGTYPSEQVKRYKKAFTQAMDGGKRAGNPLHVIPIILLYKLLGDKIDDLEVTFNDKKTGYFNPMAVGMVTHILASFAGTWKRVIFSEDIELVSDIEYVQEKLITDKQQKTLHFTGEEFIQIGELAKPFWENGVTEQPPKFVVIMGGVGAGKTTVRRQKFSVGYVNFDFGEIYTTFKKVFGEKNPKLTNYISLACDLIMKESISEKKNIVIEIIGEDKDVLTPVIDAMVKIGYHVSVSFVESDILEAYKRHLKAVKEDDDYLSSAFTQEATLTAFYQQLGLGQMPRLH